MRVAVCIGTLLALSLSFVVLLVVSMMGALDVSSTSTINRDTSHPWLPISGFNGISITSNVTTLDRLSFTYKAQFSFLPFGNYSNSGRYIRRVSQDLALLIDTNTFNFASSSIMKTQIVELAIQSGNPNSYPFDVYHSRFYIEADSNGGVPLSMSIKNTLENWNLDIMIQERSVDASLLEIIIKMKRTAAQQFFSLFIVILMWAMSLGIFLMSLGHVWYSRRVEAPTIGVVTSMLFALPAVRNMQPGAPPIGCTTDVVGFFWNMGLVATAAIILLYRFSFQESKPYIPLQNGPSLMNFKGGSGFVIPKRMSVVTEKATQILNSKRESVNTPERVSNTTATSEHEEIELVVPKKYHTFQTKPPLPPKAHSYTVPPPPVSAKQRLGAISRSLMSLGRSRPDDNDMESIGLLNDQNHKNY